MFTNQEGQVQRLQELEVCFQMVFKPLQSAHGLTRLLETS